ncbi:hypothetical protein KZZ07_21235 [Mameliella sp. CS4]|uniref:hypothetical protein n=1 Tax=Mameliella sp. CS4 TaxID=2862329 RepID=UPI001C5E99A6|nr:hypothetical protein [Mameliella sp. CS4]MBW4985072.1 hypothetical protein [Mameliella sp. CS4]
MDRQIITTPAGFLQPVAISWDIDWRDQAAGEFGDGITRTEFTGFPRWIGAPTVPLDRTTIGQWRAIRAAAQGGRGIYRIRMIDPATFVRTATGISRTVACNGNTTTDGNTFSNGFGTEYRPIALAAADYAVGAEVIRVDVSSCNDVAPVVGQIMSHQDWPFAVTHVRDRGSSVYEIGIQMPLRAAITSGDVIQMQGIGRFQARESGMGRADYGAGIFSRPTLDFIEVTAR